MEQKKTNLIYDETAAISHYKNVPFEMRYFLRWALTTHEVIRTKMAYGIKFENETYYIDLFNMEEYLQTLDIADPVKAKVIRAICERADKNATGIYD